MQRQLDDVIELAYRAATAGRTAELEVALTRLRHIDAQEAFLIQDRLRSIARSVGAHPSVAGSVRQAC